MKSIETLKKLYDTSIIIKKQDFLSVSNNNCIEKNIDRIENLYTIVLLNLLIDDNYEKLCVIEKKLPSDGKYYKLAGFLKELCAKETDFDYLTDSINYQFYKLLNQLASQYQKTLPKYINVLKKISDNKMNSLYTENQEVYFFLEELEEVSNQDLEEKYNAYKKILKYRTRKVFTEFISIDFFSKAIDILSRYNSNIFDEKTFSIFIYGQLFYKQALSDANEKILFQHIDYFISLMHKNNMISFTTPPQKKSVTILKTTQLIDYFFEKNEIGNSLQSFIGKFKDFSQNDPDIIKFCDFFRHLYRGQYIEYKNDKVVQHLTSIVDKRIKLKDDSYTLKTLSIALKFITTGKIDTNNFRSFSASELIYHISENYVSLENNTIIANYDFILKFIYTARDYVTEEYYEIINVLIEKRIFNEIHRILNDKELLEKIRTKEQLLSYYLEKKNIHFNNSNIEIEKNIIKEFISTMFGLQLVAFRPIVRIR